ncbi:MAG: periplasmic heavy metal sensor [Magnetococcus sp. YQC-5]
MQGRERLVLVILLVSLAINLFLSGLVVAWWMEDYKRTAPSSVQGNHFMAGFGMLNTDVAHRPEVVAVWNRRESSVRSSMRALRAAQQRVRETLQADPWDADSLSKALAELRQRIGVSQDLWHQVLLETAAELSPEQRVQLALFVPGMGRGVGRGKGQMCR